MSLGEAGWLVSRYVADEGCAGLAGAEPPTWEPAVREHSALFFGLDAHKATIAVAVAEPGRSGEVRYLGEFAAPSRGRPPAVGRLADKSEAQVCYEAGPCGYGLYRQIVALGHAARWWRPR